MAAAIADTTEAFDFDNSFQLSMPANSCCTARDRLVKTLLAALMAATRSARCSFVSFGNRTSASFMCRLFDEIKPPVDADCNCRRNPRGPKIRIADDFSEVMPRSHFATGQLRLRQSGTRFALDLYPGLTPWAKATLGQHRRAALPLLRSGEIGSRIARDVYPPLNHPNELRSSGPGAVG